MSATRLPARSIRSLSTSIDDVVAQRRLCISRPRLAASSSALLLFLWLGTQAQAATVSLGSTTIGSITGLFGFSSLSPGTLATQSGVVELPEGPMGIGGFKAYSRDYVTFDLSGLFDQVTGATLELVTSSYTSQGPGGSFPNFTTLSHPTELFSLFDVNTPYSSLQSPFINECGCFPPTPNAAGLAAFADLGTGNVYGTFEASAASVGVAIDIALSAQAVADINAARGAGFAVGITFTGTEFPGLLGLFGAPLVQQTIELEQVNSAQRLLLTTVPEPTTWLLVVGGLVPVLAGRRKSSRKPAE